MAKAKAKVGAAKPLPPQEGFLGMETEPEPPQAAPAVGPAPRAAKVLVSAPAPTVALAVAPAAVATATLPPPVPVLPEVVEEETEIEAVIQTKLDVDKGTWEVEVYVLAPGGELLGDGRDEGKVTPFTDAQGVVHAGTNYDLLGLGVARGLELLEGMTAEERPVGTPIIIEANTWASGVLQVMLHDWRKAGLCEPDGKCRHHHSQEQWQRVARYLPLNRRERLAKIRWLFTPAAPMQPKASPFV